MQVCSVCQQCYEDTVSSCTKGCLPALSKNRDGDPRMIDGYRLDSCIRSGANFGLYRAHELASGAACVIRIVSTGHTDSGAFLHEAKLASALFHPNIVEIYQAGILDNGAAFVVTADENGLSLRNLLDSSGVPALLTTIKIVRQAAEALHALHLVGVTHRAVSPENIVITKDDDEVVARLLPPDFAGLVERSILSNKFAIDGELSSIRYLAPEQCSDEAPTAQTDIYSLGIVFYELLTSAPPFDAPSATALIHKHRNQSPPDVRVDNFDLRMLVTHSLTESLQKPPRLRQSSANLLARQLRHIEQLATHSSTPPPAGTVSVQPPRKIYTQPLSTPPVQGNDAFAASVHTAAIQVSAGALDIRETITDAAPIQITETIEPQQVLTTVSDEGFPIALPKPEPATVICADPVVEIQPRTPRRSRLKGWKKKLHTIAAKFSEGRVQTGIIIPSAEKPVRPEVPAVSPEQESKGEIPDFVTAVGPAEPAMAAAEIEEVLDTLEVSTRTDHKRVVPAEIDVAVEESGIGKPAPAKIEWEPMDDIPTREEVAAVAEEQLISVETEEETPDAIEILLPGTAVGGELTDQPLAASGEFIESEPRFSVDAESVRSMTARPDPIEGENKLAVAEEIIEAPRILTKSEPPPSESTSPETPLRSERIPGRVATARGKDMGLKGDLPGFRMRRYVSSALKVPLEDEEITLVRPPARQIKIDLQQGQTNRQRQPRSRKRSAPAAAPYYPTLLGASTVDSAVVTEPAEIFSQFDAPVRARISSHRSIILGLGFITLVGLAFFSIDSLSGYLQSSGSSVDSFERGQAPTGGSPVQAALTVKVPEREKLVPAALRSRDAAAEKSAAGPEVSKSKLAVAPDPKATTLERSRKTAPTGAKTVDKAAVDKKVENPRNPIEKKSPDKKQMEKKSAEKRPVEKKPQTEGKTAPGTRPRIVKTPH